MTNIRAEREALIGAIKQYAATLAHGSHHVVGIRRWAEVEQAILDFDNAAYARAYKQACEGGAAYAAGYRQGVRDEHGQSCALTQGEG